MIVARAGHPKIVVFGFHPSLSALRYELATPLLFANLLRWYSPEIFRRWEISGGSVGSVKLTIDQDTPSKDVKVTSQDGSPVPFTVRDRTLDFFAGVPGPVRVAASDREYIYSLTLPQIGDARWEPPADALKSMPRFSLAIDPTTDLWRWLALLGGAGLLAEWILFGHFRRFRQSHVLRPVLLRTKASDPEEVRR